MKVLTAMCLSWLLWRLGGLANRACTWAVCAAGEVEDWAGIGIDGDQFKVGGTD